MQPSGEVSDEERAQPWEVVFQGRVKVRREKDTSSPIIASKMSGSLICGRKEGQWLALDSEPGYMLIAAGDTVLLRVADEALVSIFYTTTGAELATLRVPPTATVAALKQRLVDLFSIPVFTQQLLLDTTLLQDSDTLQSLGLPRVLQFVRLPLDEGQGAELLKSVQAGDITATVQALQRRACPNYTCPQNNWTSLGAAALAGRLDIVAQLHQASADINKEFRGGTPLMACACAGHDQVVRFLCDMAADVTRKESQGLTALLAASSMGRASIVEYLCTTMGADLGERMDNGNTPLWLASQGGHHSVVLWLCQKGADVEAPNAVGATALMVAAEQGHLSVLEQLCEAGADKDRRDDSHLTPLIRSSIQGHAEIVKYLCGAQADVHAVTTEGACPLLLAAQHGHGDIVQQLCNHRADLERALPPHGATPVFVAVGNGHLSVVQKLCENGADKERTLHDGTTLRQLADSSGHAEIGAYLNEPR